MTRSRIQASYQNPKKYIIWTNSVIRHGQVAHDLPPNRRSESSSHSMTLIRIL